MPKRRAIPALAILAATLAACFGSPTASPSSAPEASTTPEPAATATAVPSPTYTAVSSPPSQPAEGCMDIADIDMTDLEVGLGSVDADGNGGSDGISVGQIGALMNVTRITELSGQKRSVTPPAETAPRRRGQVLGGDEFVAFPSAWFEGHLNPQAMISAQVTLTLEGEPPLDLATRFIPGNVNFDQVAVTVPDASGSGVLAVSMVWADPCFRYEASLTNEVDVVPLAATAGCALELRSYYDQVSALLGGAMTVGATPVHAFSPRNQAKFMTVGNPGIDAFILYAFDRDEPAIVAEPGSVLKIAQASSDVTVGDAATMDVWTRASVAKAVKDYPPIGVITVISRTGARQSDGTFRLRVPEDPGRYVAGVEMSYDSRCSSGTLWFVVNIDVVAPTPSATPPIGTEPPASPSPA
jgi:hypothetical protein